MKQTSRAAAASGGSSRLLYVVLRTPETNVERVKLRVSKGGHAAPEDKIRSRRETSFAQLPWFPDQADMALVHDDSDAEPRLVVQKVEGTTAIDPAAPEPVRVATPDDARR